MIASALFLGSYNDNQDYFVQLTVLVWDLHFTLTLYTYTLHLHLQVYTAYHSHDRCRNETDVVPKLIRTLWTGLYIAEKTTTYYNRSVAVWTVS